MVELADDELKPPAPKAHTIQNPKSKIANPKIWLACGYFHIPLQKLKCFRGKVFRIEEVFLRISLHPLFNKALQSSGILRNSSSGLYQLSNHRQLFLR
jgi:hypothetical protein